MFKRVFKNKIIFIFGVIVGGIIFSSLTYVIATTYYSNNVIYNNANSTLSASNVQDALDELYNKSVGPIINSVVDNEDLTATVNITVTVNPVASVCVNSAAKRTDNCTWKSVSGTSFTTNAVSSAGNYYVHVQDSGGRITHSNSITLTSATLINYITSLYNNAPKTNVTTAGDEAIIQATSVDLMKDSNNNIRYYGANPKNYVTFNNELWRIIGIVDGKVKLIRSESIGSYKFDDGSGIGYTSSKNKPQVKLLAGVDCGASTNDYSKSSIKYYLNGDYYTGLLNTAKSMISSSTWYLGAINSSYVYVNSVYNYERGTLAYQSNNTTWTGNIGLIYASDYGYATYLYLCNEYIYNYHNSNCYDTNWIYSGNSHWIITTFKSGAMPLGIGNNGTLGIINDCPDWYAYVYPTIYLNTNVLVDTNNKDGSSTYPYGLSL